MYRHTENRLDKKSKTLAIQESKQLIKINLNTHARSLAPGNPEILLATRQTCVVPVLADGILENCNNWQDPQNCAAD